MSVWEWATWASIVVLVVGSALVFAWFLRDLRRLLRGGMLGHRKRRDEDASGTGSGA